MNPINPLLQKNLSQKDYSAWINSLREKYYNEFCNEFYNTTNLFENCEPDIENQLRKRSEDDISDYKDEINNAVKRLDCQSPIPSNEYINYNEVQDKNVNQNKNEVQEDCCSELTEDEEEHEIKIFPVEDEYDYEEDYEQGYKEYYEDDNSEYGYRSYGSR
jgi:hypothetical protein